MGRKHGLNAAAVIEAFVSKINAGEVEEWASNYKDRLVEFAGRPDLQAEAKAKLQMWYNLLAQKRSAIASIYSELRKEYKTRLAGAIIKRAYKVPYVEVLAR